MRVSPFIFWPISRGVTEKCQLLTFVDAIILPFFRFDVKHHCPYNSSSIPHAIDFRVDEHTIGTL
jgi:hypothetical protein